MKLFDITEVNPISIENIKVHFCEKGNGFLIKEKKFIPDIKAYNKASLSESEKLKRVV